MRNENTNFAKKGSLADILRSERPSRLVSLVLRQGARELHRAHCPLLLIRLSLVLPSLGLPISCTNLDSIGIHDGIPY